MQTELFYGKARPEEGRSAPSVAKTRFGQKSGKKSSNEPAECSEEGQFFLLSTGGMLLYRTISGIVVLKELKMWYIP